MTRTVRVHPVDSADKRNIEARFARSGDRRFLYVVNFDNTPARLRVQAPPEFFSTLQDLRERRPIIGDEITIPAQQTAIYEMF